MLLLLTKLDAHTNIQVLGSPGIQILGYRETGIKLFFF